VSFLEGNVVINKKDIPNFDKCESMTGMLALVEMYLQQQEREIIVDLTGGNVQLPDFSESTFLKNT
jgi:hypothetical protein